MSRQPLPWQPNKHTASSEVSALNFGGGMGLYAAGFREGAEVLFRKLSEHGPQDMLVYPFVYCLRHAVELGLKEVVVAARRLLDEEGDFPDTHDLGALWNICQPLLAQVWPNDHESYKTVKRTIVALVRLDPTGDAFRYAVTTRPKQGPRLSALHPDLRHLDLGAMYGEVTVTLELLDGAATGLDVHQGWKDDALEEAREIAREMADEFRQEMRSE